MARRIPNKTYALLNGPWNIFQPDGAIPLQNRIPRHHGITPRTQIASAVCDGKIRAPTSPLPYIQNNILTTYSSRENPWATHIPQKPSEFFDFFQTRMPAPYKLLTAYRNPKHIILIEDTTGRSVSTTSPQSFLRFF